MAERKPIVLVGGKIREMPSGDTVPAASVPSATSNLGKVVALARNNVQP